MSDDMPDNPISALLSSAIQMHEMMQSYVEAGFSEAQAFALIQTIIQALVLGSVQRASDD
jgi:hypothetical protein